ncbi:hypothetical protein VD0002_g1838 [Verticillium dahliae]|nr:hypothetical protein BJF96_g8690 [Verticillium dahliae]PNH54113.1 hypothetical protein VD0003_g3354 [Verticillium dahliae]PNH68119.1 hypothetical protein VD0002_g1838 [Verticillium dahliae]RXG43063.1 hypothetical protein VDGE_06208 [Verticillium dahliae]
MPDQPIPTPPSPGPAQHSAPDRASSKGRAPGARKYTTKACQECRRRRAKCGGEKPACTRCQRRGIECAYAVDEDHRGTAPKSYVRLLQSRIHLLEQVLWLHSIDLDASVAHLMAQSSRNGHGSDMPTMSSSVSAGISSSEFDKLCYEFEGALILDDSGDINCDAEASYFGPTSGRLELPVAQDEPEQLVKTPAKPFVRDISMMNAYIVDDSLMQFQDLYLPVQPSPSITPPSLTSRSPAAPTPETLTSDELQSHLVDLYFAWDNPWHNILNEGRFRYAMKHNTKCFSLLLLNSVLAMGSRYSDRIDVRSDPADGNTAGQPYLEVAEKLIQKELHHPRMATVQSLAIMGVLYAAMGRDACGYLHQGMANRLALDMGLNIDPITLTGSQIMSDEDAHCRRQLYWALYCLDKQSAIYTGRVCTMLDSQACVNYPSGPELETSLPNLKEPAFKSHTPLLRALSTLSQMLEKVLLHLYSPRRSNQQPKRIAFFDCSRLAMRTWYYALPAELKVERTGNNNYPAAYMLGMLYHTSVILLAKPFLKALDSTNPTTDNFQANTSSPSPQLSDQEREAMHLKAKVICDEAAREICVLGAKYRKVFGSFRKCPPTANHSILQAALVTLQIHTLADDQANKRGKLSLENYLKTLKELSQSWSPPRRYWSSVSRLVQARLSAATGGASTALPHATEDANATQHGERIPGNEFMAAHEPSYNGDDAEMIQSWIGAFYEEGGFEAYLNSGSGDTADDHHMFMDVLHEMGRESNTTDSSRDNHL